MMNIQCVYLYDVKYNIFTTYFPKQFNFIDKMFSFHIVKCFHTLTDPTNFNATFIVPLKLLQKYNKYI